MSIYPPIARRAAVAPFLAMDVLRETRRLEAAGRHIVHMELGEPGFAAPRRVREAAVAALNSDRLGYSEAAGEGPLRARIARYYAERHGVEVAPDRILTTTGSSGAFILAFLAGFDPGARIGVTSPGYPAYLNILEALGLVAAPILVDEETRFAPTAVSIEAAHRRMRLDGLLLMSPANPTGAMIDEAELEKICGFCEAEDVTFVSDEIYHRLEHEGFAQTALRFSQNSVVVNSFSKYYAMTGWRLGWLVAPGNFVRPMERLQQSLAICAPTLAQRAALAAFDAVEELEAYKASYARSRALLLDRLPKMGLTRFAPPDGAFYVYADVSSFTRDSAQFCARLLDEAGVATTPGLDFDRERGAEAVRFSYAGDEGEVALGMDRLAAWLGRL